LAIANFRDFSPEVSKSGSKRLRSWCYSRKA